MYSPPMPAQQPKKKGPMATDRMRMLRDQLDAESGMAGLPPSPVAGPVAGPGSQPKPAPQAPMVQKQDGPVTGTVTTQPGPPPPAPPPAPAPPPPNIDADTESLIAQLIGSAKNVDTSAEEAEIRALMDELLGGQLMNSAAAAGASGFAQSGAQLAMEGDLRRRGARDTSQQILDLRRSEQQRAIDNAFQGIGADIDKQRATQDAEIFDMMMELLGMDLDGEPGAPNVPSKSEMFENTEEAVEDRDAYAGGEEAWREAQAEGHAKATQFIAGGGDIGDLPQRAPGPNDVQVNGQAGDAEAIYYNPETGELFVGVG